MKDHKLLPHLRELLKDKERNSNFNVKFQDLVFDYSHTKIDNDNLKMLLEEYNSKKIPDQIQSMMTGFDSTNPPNSTEKRQVLHFSARGITNDLYKKQLPEDFKIMENYKNFCNRVRNGEHLGFTGKKLVNFISIGIGGSYLASEFVYQALKDHKDYSEKSKGFNLRFLANVCPIDFKRATEGLNPEETLIIIISKTFTTKETLLNAETTVEWLLKNFPQYDNKNKDGILGQHLCAVSSNFEEATKFGVDRNNVFSFGDYIGGRYSVWSPVGGVPLSLIFSPDVFTEFQMGGESIDNDVLNNLKTPTNCVALLVGILGYYNTFYGGISARAILPYSQALCKFPAHIQQLDMESNGKQVSKVTNEFLDHLCGPVVFGEPGTNGQHSFYQLIHQGRPVACEFIGFAQSQNEIKLKDISNHEELMSNFFAQPDALANGLFRDELNCSDSLKNHKTFLGDKTSMSFLFKELNAYTCGQLLSIYEHRVAVEGLFYGINSFDQFGVELGKVNAGDVRKVFVSVNNDSNSNLDLLTDKFNSGTGELIKSFYSMRK